MSRNVPLTEAKVHFSELVNEVRAKQGKIIVEKRGKEVVAIVDIQRLKYLERLEDELNRMPIKEALSGKKIPLRQVLSELRLS